jgi:hypothetical protein
MTRIERSVVALHAAEAAYAVLILVWYICTLFAPSEGLFSVLLMPFHL